MKNEKSPAAGTIIIREGRKYRILRKKGKTGMTGAGVIRDWYSALELATGKITTVDIKKGEKYEK